MDGTGNVLLAAAAGGQSRARWPAAGPHPALRPYPPRGSQGSPSHCPEIACPCPGHPHTQRPLPGVRCWALGVRGCRRPRPATSPTFTHPGCPGTSPGGRPALGARALSAFPSGNCTKIAEGREGMETAGGSSPGRRPALARAGQGLGASVQGTQAGLGGAGGPAADRAQRPPWVSLRAPLCRQRPLTSRQCRSRPSLRAVQCGWGQGLPQPTSLGHRVAPVLGVLGLSASP